MFEWIVSHAVVCAMAQSQELPPSRSGVVLFKLPADRQRREEKEFTVLKPLKDDTKTFEIRIRPPVESTGTTADALEDHIQMLSRTHNVQPVGDSLLERHPAGFQMGIRLYVLEAKDDGQRSASMVCVLLSRKRSAAIEFVTNEPNSPMDNRAIANFIERCRLAHTEVVVEGDPPLTLYDIEESLDFLQWLVDVPFTKEQRVIFREEIVQDWKKKDPETIQSVTQVSQMRAQIAQLSADQQEVARRMGEGEVVASMRKQTDRASKLLVSIYDSAHKPIAPGDPPLTRQQSDATLELFYFMAGELEGFEAKPTAEQKDKWAKRLIETWGKMDAQWRNAIAKMPLMWAALRAGWTELKEEDREGMKKTFEQVDFIKEIRSVIVKAKSAGTADTMSSFAKIQQNHQFYMSVSKMSFDNFMYRSAAMSGFRYYPR